MEKSAPRKFYEIKSYVSEENYLIKEQSEYEWNFETNDKFFTGKTSYMGTFAARIMTEMGPQTLPIDFDFDEGMNISQCFDKFEEFAKKRVEEIKEEKRKKDLIVVPSSANKNVIQFSRPK